MRKRSIFLWRRGIDLTSLPVVCCFTCSKNVGIHTDRHTRELVKIHDGEMLQKSVYSRTSLIRTRKGQSKVYVLSERCRFYRGHYDDVTPMAVLRCSVIKTGPHFKVFLIPVFKCNTQYYEVHYFRVHLSNILYTHFGTKRTTPQTT